MFIRFITDTSLLSTLKPWSCLSHVFLHSVTPSTVRASLVLSHRFIPLLCKAARSSRPVLCTLASSFYCFHFFQYIQNIRLNFLQCYIPKAIPLLRNLLWTGSYPQLWGTFRGPQWRPTLARQAHLPLIFNTLLRVRTKAHFQMCAFNKHPYPASDWKSTQILPGLKGQAQVPPLFLTIVTQPKYSFSDVNRNEPGSPGHPRPKESA